MIMLHIGVPMLSDICTALDSNKTRIDHLLTISYFFNSNMV